MKKVSDALIRMTELCDVRHHADELVTSNPTEFVSKVQLLMRNMGVHHTVMNILKLPLRRSEVVRLQSLAPGVTSARNVKTDRQVDPIPGEQGKRDLFAVAYQYLTNFILHCPLNQNSAFEHLSVFWSHMGTRGLAVADMLAAMFRDNKMLIGKVDEALLVDLFTKFDNYGKMARWLRLLER
jgi:hypothetical protein